MENKSTPTALILTRQDVKDLPSASGNRYQDALAMERGGYVVVKAENPVITLVANGSEVSAMTDAAAILKEQGIECNVVSVPSIGLFLDQSIEYRQEVISPELPIFGLTAGLPSTLAKVVGCNGNIKGLERYGASAPYKVLDEKFGFTPVQVAEDIKAFLG